MEGYVIEPMDLHNTLSYARVNALAWLQTYKGIVDDEFLQFINTEEEIRKASNNLKNGLNDDSKRFLLKFDSQYVGILRIRKTKYEKYLECGELGALYLLDNVKGKGFGKILFQKAVEELKHMGYKSMIIGCLVGNSSNEFYKHMGGKLVDTNLFVLPNGNKLLENLYYFDI